MMLPVLSVLLLRDSTLAGSSGCPVWKRYRFSPALDLWELPVRAEMQGLPRGWGGVKKVVKGQRVAKQNTGASQTPYLREFLASSPTGLPILQPCNHLGKNRLRGISKLQP